MQKDELKKLKEQLISKFLKLCNEAKQDPKQLMVGVVILVVALLLLILAFSGKKETREKVSQPHAVEQKVEAKEPVVKQQVAEKKPEKKQISEEEMKIKNRAKRLQEIKNIKSDKPVLVFTATAEKDFDFQVFYTVEREVWFDPSHVITYKVTRGENNYRIDFPAKEVYRIRLDFGEAPGEVTIKDIYVTGSQFTDLNDFTLYSFNQIDSQKINKDNSLTIKASGRDSFMAYSRALLEE